MTLTLLGKFSFFAFTLSVNMWSTRPVTKDAEANPTRMIPDRELKQQKIDTLLPGHLEKILSESLSSTRAMTTDSFWLDPTL